MKNTNSNQEQTKPTPDLATLMEMGVYIPSEIKVENLTEKGKELAGIKKES